MVFDMNGRHLYLVQYSPYPLAQDLKRDLHALLQPLQPISRTPSQFQINSGVGHSGLVPAKTERLPASNSLMKHITFGSKLDGSA